MSGFGGAYGGLFSSTVMVVMLILEVARPGGQRFAKALVGVIVAPSVSFGIYFAIAGAVFLDAYQVPQYAFEDWQLLAAIPLGLLAAVAVTLLLMLVQGAARLFGRLKLPGIVRSPLHGRNPVWSPVPASSSPSLLVAGASCVARPARLDYFDRGAKCWFSHMPRTPVYRLWVVSGDGAIFVFLRGVSAIVARFLRNLRRISDGRRDAARSCRPVGSRTAHHPSHPHYRHPVLR